jgi:glycosyltransferase involved in cell wall biosynthesis
MFNVKAEKSANGPRILYIVYWGAMEPLGQSLVLPAVKKLSALGAQLALVTFEKPADMTKLDEIAGIRRSLQDHNIEWTPLVYHKRPKIPATAFDILQGWVQGIRARLSFKPDIIHARTFIGGLIGLTLAPAIGAKFIYHNEGFYPDEQVDGGVWQKDSAPHRVARSLEKRMYSKADAVIAMSHRGRNVIAEMSDVKSKDTPVIVVPSCVNLELFRDRFSDKPELQNGIKLVYAGSVGGRYILDRIGRFVAVAQSEAPQTYLNILTRTGRSEVESMLAGSGLAENSWSLGSVPYIEMPEQLSRNHAGLFFLSQGLSEHGCSPTKVGEYWAMGLPVITTPNVSDIDEIILRERVGVIVRDHGDDEYRRAFNELIDLLKDSDLPARCRSAAENHYALDSACVRQMSLYEDVFFQTTRAAGNSEFGKA